MGCPGDVHRAEISPVQTERVETRARATVVQRPQQVGASPGGGQPARLLDLHALDVAHVDSVREGRPLELPGVDREVGLTRDQRPPGRADVVASHEAGADEEGNREE